MHFIDQFNKDASAILGFDVKIEVNRGDTIERKRWVTLSEENVSCYDYCIHHSEEYRITPIIPQRSSPLNGYWNGVVANFYLQYLPGCCGVCLSYHSNVTHMFRGKKIGKLTRQLRQDIAFAQGFTTMLSTATSINVQQNAIMKSAGALPVYSFKNERSHNEVIISVSDLRNKQTNTVPLHHQMVTQKHMPATLSFPSGRAMLRAA